MADLDWLQHVDMLQKLADNTQALLQVTHEVLYVLRTDMEFRRNATQPAAPVLELVDDVAEKPTTPIRKNSDAPRARTRWTEAQKNNLIRLWVAEVPIEQIAETIGRTPKACRDMVGELREEGLHLAYRNIGKRVLNSWS